jgi:hypothetical protein
MPIPNSTMPASNYDSRWFIWTIVFLVVTGISLVSYITLSSGGVNETPNLVIAHQATHKALK